MYKRIVRSIIFLLSPEGGHNLALKMLSFFGAGRVGEWLLRKRYTYRSPRLERDVFGITFPNPIGVAAGYDTDGKYHRKLAAMGFGFVEVGTITPKPQPGSMRPRLFRLNDDKAIINRIGFDNGGMESALHNLRHREHAKRVITGANISKTTLSQNDVAATDYLRLFRNLYQYVNYFVVTVTESGNGNLEVLQTKENINKILDGLIDFRRGQTQYRPILLKISPDWSKEQIDDAVDILIDTQLDGLVVAGTTSSREGLKTSPELLERIGPGGLSGAPLRDRTIELIKYTGAKMEWRYPLIASGGVMTPEDAQMMLDAGASLVEIYTGLVFNGPKFAKKICKHLDAVARERETAKERAKDSTENTVTQ